MKKPTQAPNLREEIVRLARDARVDLTAFERATLLGQVASLLASHPRIGNSVAFKGGAIANLVDGSLRLSKDLDSGIVQARGRIKAEWVRAALTETAEARRIVKRVDDIHIDDAKGMYVPVIVCHPRSGLDDINLEFTIKWSEPLLLDPVVEWIDLPAGRGTRRIALPVMARVERVAEKIATFLNRGEDRDAYDLYHFADPDPKKGMTSTEWSLLPGLTAQKVELDPHIVAGSDLKAEFERRVMNASQMWARRGNLIVKERVPGWGEVEPRVRRYKSCLPDTKIGLARAGRARP